ncbi:CpaF family protein [Acidocella aromatica]|uniref:Pilus assembly protein CpaF n=1 Tax=Acidocella aromatica TaxID=1303579 RepID=A0A840V9D6_9PROT|nr:CpaF family protein [Acidocella aromatica]MBB5372343.1 pilus assembly protein CpaF [Acidocella aromatica]
MSDGSLPVFGRRRTETPEPTNAGGVVRTPAPSPAPGLAQVSAPPAAGPIAVRAEITELRNLCLARMDATAVASLHPDRLLIEVERLIADLATEKRMQLNGREQRSLATELVDDMLGLGPLEPLLLDESINDIMVNGPDHTFVERGGKLVQVPVRFRDWTHLTNICQRIAASVGRRVDEASPMCDARLKDGSRVNIILPPLSIDGPAISIRKFSKKPIDFEKLIQFGAMTPPIARVLEIAARTRLNIIVSGGTGSGKTTMMNALSRFIDPAERIVTIEDAAELQLQQPHVVRLETRPPSLEGKGEVTARDLVRNALRMRPDRVIIGETRGAEAFDMLQAMNTGHDGSMSTIHANNTRDALARIENMVQMSSMGLTSRAIKMQLCSAVNLIVQVERQRDGGRRVTQVTEIAGMEGETTLMNDIFKLEITGETANGRLTGRYEVSRIRSTFQERLQYYGLDRAWMNALDEA